MKKTILHIAVILLISIIAARPVQAQCTYFTKVVSSAGGTVEYSLGIKNDGTLWAWGRNSSSQLGDGTTTDKTVPTQIGAATNWVLVSTGKNNSLGITADGKLWAWGDNTYGQLGDGTTTARTVPTQIGTATNWILVSATQSFSLGITADGKLWAWGDNSYGQLGDGTTTAHTVPAQIGTATNWVSVVACVYNSLGITADGKLWAWGNNTNSQLGDGTTATRYIPTQIGTATNWVSVSGGFYHSLGITADGKLWAWGDNTYGQLGDGTTITRNRPTQIGTATNWVSVSGGFYHSLGITADGKLWAWGFNGYGQLGDGTTTTRHRPTQIGSATNWVSVSGGSYHSLGITADGKLWAWGYNSYGQLGDGTTTNRTSLTQIGLLPTFTGLATTGATASMQQIGYNVYSSSCALIASVRSNSASLTPIAGSTKASVWIETIQPAQYVKRHFEITPATNATTATGRVTLYFTQAEFDDFNAVNTLLLPSYSGDVAGIGNLRVEKHPGKSSDGTGLPGTYTGTAVTIDPADADIIWNSTAGRWEVSFDVTGFSGFFIKTAAFILPQTWLSVTGKINTQQQAVITWKVQEQNVASYQIQKSVDGITFSNAATVTSKGNGENNYSFTDNTALSGTAYYRLLQTDRNGKQNYSSVVIIQSTAKGNAFVGIYPNPITNIATLSVNDQLLNTKASLLNMEGRLLQKINIQLNTQTIALNGLRSGIYLLKFSNGEMVKLVKE